MRIAWDEAKSASNQEKHAISFEEAQEVLLAGASCLEIFDEAHSDIEDRFISIGPISRGLVLVVWTERDDDVIRIISARWATARERSLYHRHLGEHHG